MPKKPRKRKATIERVPRKPHPLRAFLRAILRGLKQNKGGLLLAAVLIQLMTFLVLMAMFIEFRVPEDDVFGKPETSKTRPVPKPGAEPKEKGLPLFHTSAFAAYAIACLGLTLLFRGMVARRSFRILLYLQTPGLVLALYAIGRLAWRGMSHS